MEYRHVLDPDRKEKICLRILHALPAWFGDWKAARQYAKNTRAQFFLCALEDEEPLAFSQLRSIPTRRVKLRDGRSAGISPPRHWLHLIEAVRAQLCCARLPLPHGENACRHGGQRFLCETRAFYLACGFEPLEIFETLWNEENPCLYLVKPLFDGQGTKPMEF